MAKFGLSLPTNQQLRNLSSGGNFRPFIWLDLPESQAHNDNYGRSVPIRSSPTRNNGPRNPSPPSLCEHSGTAKGLAWEEEVRTVLLVQGQQEVEVLREMGVHEGNDVVTGPATGSGRKVHSDDYLSIEIPETAHLISQDSWLQVSFVLTTGINSAYVLGYSAAIMVPLGWIGGVVGLIAATALSLYANALVAKLHEHGGKRHIRYRDLAGFIYGREAYFLTWGLQYLNLFMINVGYIILAGSALKATYVLFQEDHVMKLPYFIAIAGLACVIFAIAVPHLSALRVWLGFSTLFSLVYIVVALVLSLKDGIAAPPRDYSIPGTKASRIFTTIGASANLFFAFNTGMLPEIQATVKQPVVENMIKALNSQFTVGVLPLYAVTFIGYWAYGSDSSAYLLNNVNGPCWIKATADICAFLQSIIALHIFASPMYECLDTRYGIKGSALAIRNLSFRIIVRGGYLGITTFVSAMLPFLGDFMSLTGALSTFPLTFILANHMYLTAKKSKLTSLQTNWHWFNVIFFTLMSFAAVVAGLRLIAVDSSFYHLFADL